MVAPTGQVLSERVTRFGRLLRGAGLEIGPGQILEGLDALTVVDITRRVDFYWTLHSAWVTRGEDRDLFREAFRLFWREPDRPVNRVLEELLASSRMNPERPPRQAIRRVLDALAEERSPMREREEEVEETVRLAASDVETLRTKDFEQMTTSEIREAQRELERLSFPTRDVRTRRWRSVPSRGEIDLRRTVRRALRRGRDHIPLELRRRRTRPPDIVALCDISGSMAGYTRMLLRFLHALAGQRDRVDTFLFGTRLSNVTRSLRHKDIDVSLAEVGRRVLDWEGGTRIGACLADFNYTWSRRVLARGAVVLLITDGLDRGEPGALGREMARLRRSARSVIWLNPLLRFSEFRPEARGIREMLPHVDDFRPAHNVASLEELAAALSDEGRQASGRSVARALPEQRSEPRA